MRELVRLLIALNWTVAGCSFVSGTYLHPTAARMDAMKSAEEDIAPSSDDEAHWERVLELAARYQSKNQGSFNSGQFAWRTLVVVGCVNAVGLIILFRRLPYPVERREPNA